MNLRIFPLLVCLASLAGCAQPRPSSPASRLGTLSDDKAHADIEAIGSLRNARVAYPDADGKVPLTYLAGAMTDDQRDSLAKLAPNVRIISGLDRQTALEHAAEADGADGQLLTPAFMTKATKLVWVASPSAGVDRYAALPRVMTDDRIVLTNSRAIHGPAIADHAFAMLLTLTRNLRGLEKLQAAHDWQDGPAGPRPIALQGRTMLVVGIGGIGSEIAQRAHGFGMRVIATRRTDAPAPEYVEHVGKPDELLALLPKADVVAICVPLTKETQRLFDAKAFAAMKSGAYLINIARGKVVDTDALIAALREGRLAGACLDVTDPEPLPPDHALWLVPNVIITPHVSSDADVTDLRRAALVRENIRRFGAGEPLLNTVDKQAGY